MTCIELHERDRGRVIPPPAENTTTVNSWRAHLALDADTRTKYPAYRALAARLIIVEVES